jgi:lycopene cyclase domain-containing protein
VTYLQFHLTFILPPIAALLYLVWRRRPVARIGGGKPWAMLGLILLAAFVYTTPWDNYLVYREVWTYPPGAVLATIGYVPVEEYAFFLLQPILTGLFLFLLLQTLPFRPEPVADPSVPRRAGASLWMLVVLAGAWMLWAGGHWLYMGLILAWAPFVLAGLWWLGGHTAWAWRRLYAVAVAVPTLYLWYADHTAIALGIWDITDATRTGIEPFGLPIEEAIFFLLTNLLVVHGLVMLLLTEEADAARPSAG